MTIKSADILNYWYSDEMRKHWFASTEALDEQIRKDYQAIWQVAADGDLKHWKTSPEGCLALAIILDQLPLNMFRNSAKSFSTEQLAVEITNHAISMGFDEDIEKDKRAFLYMPLMHSENIDDQNLSVAMFEKSDLKENARFAEHHRNIVRTYGRFPHRNHILGRQSTDAEIEYLNSDQAFKG